MGTRGLIGFVIKGKRMGTYNWWDSYPQSLGKVLMPHGVLNVSVGGGYGTLPGQT